MNTRFIEIQNLSQIVSYINDSSLILLDIDDTLIRASTYLGSKDWVAFLRRLLSTLKKEALIEPLIWNILPQVSFSLVESSSVCLIRQIQNEYLCTILGYTARPFIPYKGSDFTIHLLENLGIHFEQSSNTDVFNKVLGYKRGVIFTDGVEKGVFLENVLCQIKFKYHSVVFVDDRIEQIQSVATILQKHGIDYHCFFYKPLEKLHELFDERACAVQMHFLRTEKKILSNSAASERKAHSLLNLKDVIKQLIEQYEKTLSNSDLSNSNQKF